jgi:predicted site-specific integrase-resolvase
MNYEHLLRPKDVCRILNVSHTTLIEWDKRGKLQCMRTKGGHRRYTPSSVFSHLSNQASIPPRENVCYARVSSHSQKEDLDRQASTLRSQFPDHRIITDIGSGLNFKRKGLCTLLELAVQGTLGEVVVTHKDRLCRFGFDLLENIITQCSKGRIVVLSSIPASPHEELTQDLLSIITVFSARMYGLRSHSFRKKIQELACAQTCENSETTCVPNPTSEGDLTDVL